ncbi:hypothetical protein BDY24DRAFT_338518, partial [Mrakia frigida]|uniref:uncharacterized protein n=1 Tax=Mrakia frigida TaxID=29902 RepID=UPI003FCC1C93
FSPKIEKLVNTLSVKDFTSDLRWLTGEDESSPILSRHSFSSTAVVAARWIKKTVEAETPGVKCTLSPFLPGFTPNVLCEYPQILSNATEGASKGDLERNVIVSGHYDSRGSFGSTRAPGADDDGSGTVQLLGIARAMGRAGLKGFKEKVTLAFFAGEEQGLLGSRAFAKELYEANATVLIQVQADMLAYHDPNEPMQLGFPDLIGTPEAAFLLGNLSQIYSPALVVGKTGACCSDHQSFNSYGFAATQVFERNGGIIDPMYHNSGDLSDRPGFDFEQLKEIAKVTVSSTKHSLSLRRRSRRLTRVLFLPFSCNQFSTLLEVGLPVF